MNFFNNLIKIQLKRSKNWIIIIILLSFVSNQLIAQTSGSRDPKVLIFSDCKIRSNCDLLTTKCNRYLGLCECRPKFPLAVQYSQKCLDYRNLGQECAASEQCRTDNSICVTSESKILQINPIDEKIANNYFEKLKLNKTFNYIQKQRKENFVGQCKCKTGYKQVAGKSCVRILLNVLTCEGAYECQEADLNSHCNKESKRCYCDPGYVYDNDKNQCTIITKKYGDLCAEDYECQNWDPNMVCLRVRYSPYLGNRLKHSKCLCATPLNYDYTTQTCKPHVEQRSAIHESRSETPIDSRYSLCNPGFRWDEKNSECERDGWRYGARRYGDYGFISLDKFLETIVIVIFCCVTIAFLRFWRNILPQSLTSESQNGIFSDYSHTNRVQRRRTSRSNSLSRRERVIQLRVNLRTPESENLSHQTFVALPPTNSHSSLPTYESASLLVPMIDNNDSHESHPPPYSEDPPTYEEAIKLFQTTKL